MCLPPSWSSQPDSKHQQTESEGGNLSDSEMLCCSTMSVSSPKSDMDPQPGWQWGDHGQFFEDLCSDLHCFFPPSRKVHLLHCRLRWTSWQICAIEKFNIEDFMWVNLSSVENVKLWVNWLILGQNDHQSSGFLWQYRSGLSAIGQQYSNTSQIQFQSMYHTHFLQCNGGGHHIYHRGIITELYYL